MRNTGVGMHAQMFLIGQLFMSKQTGSLNVKMSRRFCMWLDRGYWSGPGVMVKEALDTVGGKQFVEVFEDHSRFHWCEACPHTA